MQPENDTMTLNSQRRAMLRSVLVTGCALSFPVLWGCKQKEPPSSPSTTNAVPPASDRQPPPDTQPSLGAQPSTDPSPVSGKMSKEQAKYQAQPKGDQQCSNCIQFVADSNVCKLVEGQIAPQGWCILWVGQPA